MTVADGQDSLESRIRRAAAAGELVELHGSDVDHFAARHLGADAPAGHEVPAALIIELLAAGRPPGTAASPAVRLCGATITGCLNLEAAKLTCPLLLELCQFTEPVVLDDAEAPKLTFSGCHVPGLTARRLRTVGSLALDGPFTSTAGVDLTGAHIGGQLLLDNARVFRPDDLGDIAPGGTVWALAADGISVDEDISARMFYTDGQVRLLSARVKGQIDMTGAEIDASADNQLANAERIALMANQLSVDGDVTLWDFSSKGQAYLRGAVIGGQLILDGAHLVSPGSSSLWANHMSVGQDMSCSGGFSSEGEISLACARIGGHLTFTGASLANSGHRALYAEWITIGKSLVCDGGFTADGEIALSAARIDGQVVFVGASLSNPGGTALSARRTDIGQTLAFQHGSHADGEVNMPGARIAGYASFTGGHLTNPDGTALDASGITTGSHLRLWRDFTAEGKMNLENAEIGGDLDFGTATLNASGSTVLSLGNAVAAKLNLCLKVPPGGAVDLTGAHTGGYADDPASWPQALHLRGFTYDTLENSAVSVRNRLRWLALHPGGYTPQVYDQLAACYRNAGRDEAARRVSVAKQRHRRNTFSPLNWLWYVTVGYGYRTWLAAVWLAVLAIAGTFVFASAYSRHLLVPAAHAPAFHPLVYTLDTLLPVVRFGQASAWTPTGWALPWSWSFTAAGWFLTTAAVAALTGIFKRD